MEIDSEDEKFIRNAYRHYQKSRDSISQASLFKLKIAAHDFLYSEDDSINMVSKDMHETSIQQIKHTALKKFIIESPHQEIAQSRNRLQNFSWLIKCLDYLMKPAWVGAIASALFVSLILIKLGSTVTPDALPIEDRYFSKSLHENPQIVVENLPATGEMQYGFSNNENTDFEVVFTGMMLIDLKYLDPIQNNNELENLLIQLSNHVSDLKKYKINEFTVNSNLANFNSKVIGKINADISKHYQEDSKLVLFNLGQWIEFNFLQSDLALQEKRLSLFDLSVYESIHDLNNSELPTIISERISKLPILKSSSEFTIDDIENINKILNNIRLIILSQ